MAKKLRPEPYSPDAIDADNDGILQEGTAFERPAGTRLVNRAGLALQRGMESLAPVEGLQVVDLEGNPVAYTPTWSGALEVSPDKPSRLPTLQSRGLRTVGDMSPSLKDRGLSI